MDEWINNPKDDEQFAAGEIYRELASHQRNSMWYGRDVFRELQAWMGRFDDRFKLGINEVVLRVDSLPVSVMGHYRHEPNGLGLKGEVAINVRYLVDRAYWQVLAILLHQCVHAWQSVGGTPARDDHHNLEFRQKAAELGLLVDRRGVTYCAANSPFFDLLRVHGVEVPRIVSDDGPEAGRAEARITIPRTRLASNSKQKKWACQCTVVRCATAMTATCDTCHQKFTRRD